MLKRTLHNKVKSSQEIEKEFETVRKCYNKDLSKLRKKYQGVFAALTLSYGESLEKSTQ